MFQSDGGLVDVDPSPVSRMTAINSVSQALALYSQIAVCWRVSVRNFDPVASEFCDVRANTAWISSSDRWSSKIDAESLCMCVCMRVWVSATPGPRRKARSKASKSYIRRCDDWGRLSKYILCFWFENNPKLCTRDELRPPFLISVNLADSYSWSDSRFDQMAEKKSSCEHYFVRRGTQKDLVTLAL